MKRSRIDRKNDFESFYSDAIAIFNGFRDADNRAEKFERLYMLHVCPGSRAGGTDKRMVEIFWGSRPFETITEGRNWKTLTEYGATLVFSRDDNGFVIISLYPALTDNRRPIETSITTHIWLDPKKLKDISFLKSRWKDFMAYMEHTSLDGNPTTCQQLRVAYLRKFKNLIIDNRWTPKKISTYCQEVLKYVLTVGLSGSIIYLVTLITSNNKNDIQLEENNKKIEILSSKIDTILKMETVSKNVLSDNDRLTMTKQRATIPPPHKTKKIK